MSLLVTTAMQSERTARAARAEVATLPKPDTSLAGVTRWQGIVTRLAQQTPSLWPLADYVAVNPFFGFIDRDLLAVRSELRRVRDCEVLMPLSYSYARLVDGTIQPGDVLQAWDQCREEMPTTFAGLSFAEAMEIARPGGHSVEIAAATDRLYFTVAELLDESRGSDWREFVTGEISRHCAAQHDEGQATWKSPWAGQPLYQAWRAQHQHDRRCEFAGLPGMRELAAALPEAPLAALDVLVRRLGVPEHQVEPFLAAQLATVAGWASFLRRQDDDLRYAGKPAEEFVGLIAIRLAYDVALALAAPRLDLTACWPAGGRDHESSGKSVLVRYLLLVASEIAYRRRLLASLNLPTGSLASAAMENDLEPATDKAGPAKKVQMAFCIDVRSEVFRRHLEAVTSDIATLGFAGFFGMPLELVGPDAEHGRAQCPALLRPNLQVEADLEAPAAAAGHRHHGHRCGNRQTQKSWKRLKASGTTGFSFVESFGLGYLGSLIRDSLGFARGGTSHFGRNKPTEISSQHLSGTGTHSARPAVGVVAAGLGNEHPMLARVGLDRQVELAAALLRNLGVIRNFPRLLVLCGHESRVTNNPYAAALHCGACGGHSGAPNARFAAALVNAPAVRTKLRERGIDLPDTLHAVAAVHETSTDVIHLLDVETLPVSHQGDLADLRAALAQAATQTRLERAKGTGDLSIDALLRRADNWAEVRPEWGLAGNAAMIVGPRALTQGVDLQGRAFLHHYDEANDPTHAVLELILTAPAVVGNWINMGYYASVVDPEAFGSGNKTIQNVVGRVGVVEGNGGDLRAGLPWQSVHDGTTLRHEPLRLTVVVAAARSAIGAIVERHAVVKHLATKGWITLIAVEAGQTYRLTAHGAWAAL